MYVCTHEKIIESGVGRRKPKRVQQNGRKRFWTKQNFKTEKYRRMENEFGVQSKQVGDTIHRQDSCGCLRFKNVQFSLEWWREIVQ